MDDRNKEFIKSNLSLNSLESLKVNLVGIYTLEGKWVWGMAYDSEIKEEVTVQELSEDSLNPANPLLGTPESVDTVAGLYNTSAGIYMIASRPILSSRGDGPSRGRILMGRQLSKVAIDRLAVQARVNLSVSPLVPAEGFEIKPPDNNDKIRYTPITLEESDAITHGTINIMDVTGVLHDFPFLLLLA